MKIKIGCDPELFIRAGTEYISAYGIVPGTKDAPHEVDKGAVQVDGFAAEFNINPAETPEDFDRHIDIVLTQLDEIVKKVDPKFELAFVPYAKFDRDYFEKQPKESKILGCDPDFYFDGSQSTPLDTFANEPHRTAAGHIHIGFREDGNPQHPTHFANCMKIAQGFLGKRFYTAQTLLEKKRLKYYGGFGSFRPKSYGIELRSPSNRWVEDSSTRRAIFRETMQTFNDLRA